MLSSTPGVASVSKAAAVESPLGFGRVFNNISSWFSPPAASVDDRAQAKSKSIPNSMKGNDIHLPLVSAI